MTTLFDEMFGTEKDFKWIKSSDDVYTIEAALAGFSKDDIEITADQEVLIVKAKKEERNKSFSIKLNSLVNPSDITSKMDNGLLTITMPKKQIKESFAVKIE